MNTTLEDVKYYLGRKLDKEFIVKLSMCCYIDSYIKVIVTGAIGAEMAYSVFILGNVVCNKTKVIKYIRLSDLLSKSELSRIQEIYKNKI